MNSAALLKETEIGSICRDWDLVPLADIKAGKKFSIVDGPFGTQLHSNEYVDSGVPVVRVNNLSFDGRFLPDGLVYISEEKLNQLSRSAVYPGDIVVAKTGATIGKLAIFPDTYSHGLVASSCMKLTVDEGKADTRYVFYFLMSVRGQTQIRNLAYGSTRDTINIAPFSEIKLPLPPLTEQHAIAHILGTLDDKIGLNHRMNQTLEAMAQALFKSWFVDFEPFRDKGMQDSPIGQIPVGWTVGVLGDIAENLRRGAQPGQIDSHTPYIGLEHMPRHSIALSEWGSGDSINSGKFAFRQGELLFGKLRPYFHKVGIAPVDGVCSTDILVLAPKEQKWFGHVLGCISSDEFVAYADAGSTGTKMPRADWHHMSRYRAALPAGSVAESFTRIIEPLLERIALSIAESRALAGVRDTLLPRLLSGEIRVKDPEEFVEEWT